MTTNNKINAQFHQIAITDVNGNVIDVTVPGKVTANVFEGDGSNLTNIQSNTANTSNVANVANLAIALDTDIANVKIAGGNSGYILQTDGAGNLSWGSAPTTANANYANFAGTAYSVDGSNVVGEVANSNYASYANITSTANVALSVDASNVSNLAQYVANANTNVANYAGDVINASQPNITSLGTLTSLSVAGLSNLGPVGNLTIIGGNSGDYLQTDGSGVLSWVAPSVGTQIVNGSSNVDIPTSGGDVEVNVNSTQVALFSINDSNISSNLNVTGDATAANFSTTGGVNAFDATLTDLYVNGISNLNDVSNVKINGGNPGEYLQTDGTGNLSWTSIATVTPAAPTNSLQFNDSGVFGGTSFLWNGATDSIESDDGTGNILTYGNAQTGVIARSIDTVGLSYNRQVSLTADAINITNNLTGDNTQLLNTGITTLNVTTTNLTANGLSNLGAVGNVTITGGSSGQALITDGSGVLSWANVAYVPFKYSREWHVSPDLGNDTTGDGSYEKPYATIAKIKAVIGTGTGHAVFLHVGPYTESVTWTNGNTDFIGLVPGGTVNITGNWVFSHAGAGSVRVRDVAFNGTLGHTGTGPLFLESVNVNGAFSKSGSGYLECRDRTEINDTTSSMSVTGSGTVVVQDGSVNLLTVNNASAVVALRNTNAAVLTLLAGTLGITESFVYSATATSAAVTTSAGSILYTYNSHFATPTGTLARVSVGGFWTLNDVQYDRANSTLTGTNLGTVSHFDSANIYGVANLGAVGNVRITGGSNAQVLTTNGSGNLSWTTVSVASIANGTSNVNIPVANGAVLVGSGGVANVAVFDNDRVDLNQETFVAKKLTVDEGLGLGNVVVDPVSITVLVSDTATGATVEMSTGGLSVNDNTGPTTFVGSGQITLMNGAIPALPTLPEHVTTKEYVDNRVLNVLTRATGNVAVTLA